LGSLSLIQNKAVIYGIRFKAAAEKLITIAADTGRGIISLAA
jgi:hypothetical protein